MGGVLNLIYAIVACILSIAMCVACVMFIYTGRHDRDDEEAARDYFSAHGHWPDEDSSTPSGS